jgi:ferric-dicitrate binding protein FerR (iron transport regulator)
MVLTQGRAMAKLSMAARLAACALVAILIVAHPNESRADVWNWLTGLVTDHPDTEAAALSGEQLPPDAIVTKDGEKRVLHMGRDVLELYPSSAVTIEETGPNTSVRLITGTLRVKVAKRKKGQAFDVRTLMLVATVKGTEFEVSTTGNGSAVSVYEGRVAVKATGRVGGLDVTPGKTATVTGAEDAPALGPTPAGGAAAATKALGRAEKASSTSGGSDDDDGGHSGNKDVSTAGRGTPSKGAGSGSSGGSGSGGAGGEGEGGGEDGDGEGGEGGKGGEDGDDD